jgi:ankyrin repeat protein
VEVVSVLLIARAPLEALDEVRLPIRPKLTCLQYGRTPLHYACSDGHPEVISVLLTAGAQVNRLDQQVGVVREIDDDLFSVWIYTSTLCLHSKR